MNDKFGQLQTYNWYYLLLDKLLSRQFKCGTLKLLLQLKSYSFHPLCGSMLDIAPTQPVSHKKTRLIVTAQLNLNWSWSETLKWVGSHPTTPPPGTFKALPGNLGS